MKDKIKLIKDYLYTGRMWFRRMYIYPKMDLRNVNYDTYWKDKRGDKIGSLSDWQKDRADFILNTLSDKKEILSIVDVGCGDGSILNYIKNNRKENTRMFGIDISEFALARAGEFGVTTTKADITKITGDDIQTADYGILFEILEHVPDSERMLNTVYEKIQNGVFFSFPNTGFIVHRLRLLFGKFPLQWRVFPGEHLRYWTANDLKWWLKSLGYKNYKIHYYRGVPILNKIFPNMFAAGFIVYIQK